MLHPQSRPTRSMATVKVARSGRRLSSLAFNPWSRLCGWRDKECYQPSVTSSMAVFNSEMPPVTSIARKKNNKKKLYTGRIRVFPMLCTIGPIHYLLCRAKYKNKKQKGSTKSPRLLAIAPSSNSTDQLLEKRHRQSTTHFPGLSAAF